VALALKWLERPDKAIYEGISESFESIIDKVSFKLSSGTITFNLNEAFALLHLPHPNLNRLIDGLLRPLFDVNPAFRLVDSILHGFVE